ncbi:nucleotidyltransferase family protein [Teredinibacter turnerae]|uniref:nucleotidyltransferase family protein n=1 Tax=Teredinibacter turnerae TaxID=2426 RepID=UPI0004214BE0|nr:nucleotidyltransferase family protein [Teredinibacter turnerae]
MIMNVTSWRSALLEANASIRDAIESLDRSSLQIALVVSPEFQLLGTVTDGDIRRALIKGVELTSPINGVMNQRPLVVPPKLGKTAVLQLMQANKILQLPEVNEHGQVCGLHLLEDMVAPPALENTLVIMAGGKGTRLRPLTQNCPKPMLPVGGKPMLEHIVLRAKSEGIGRVVMAINYLGEMIEEYFGDGSAWQMDISYLREQNALGTAGALSMLPDKPEAPILVCNGDVLTDIHYADFLDFHCKNQAIATMAVKQHEWRNPFGVVRTDGVDIISFDEKPISRCHINAGIYVLSPAAMAYLQPNSACDMPGLFEKIQADSGKIIAYPMHEPWLDVGRPDDLAQARQAHTTEARL